MLRESGESAPNQKRSVARVLLIRKASTLDWAHWQKAYFLTWKLVHITFTNEDKAKIWGWVVNK